MIVALTYLAQVALLVAIAYVAAIIGYAIADVRRTVWCPTHGSVTLPHECNP